MSVGRRTSSAGAGVSAPRTVAIIGVSADDEPRSILAWSLEAQGFTVRTAGAELESAPPYAVVVIMSDDALADGTWRAGVEASKGERIVPVVVGRLDTDVPDHLAELNWIKWNAVQPAETEARTFVAVNTDLDRYRRERSLESAAAAWIAAGQAKDVLMLDTSEVRSGLEQIERREASAPQDPAVAAYLQASLKAAKKNRRRRFRRWIFRLGIAALVAVLVTTVLLEARESAQGNLLTLSLQDLSEDRPDLTAIKLSGLLVHQSLNDGSYQPIVIRRIGSTLSVPWSSGIIGSQHDSAVNEVVLLADTSQAITVDGMGTVSSWSTESAAMRWRREVEGPLYNVDASPDGSVVVAASDNKVHVMTVDPWTRVTVDLPAKITDVVVGPRGTAVAVTEGGRIYLAQSATAQASLVGAYDAVLDIDSTDAEVVALVRQGEAVQLVDALTGAVVTATNWPRNDFESGALAPDLRGVALSGLGRQVWYAADGLALVATGHGVPDTTTAMAVTDDGVVVVATDQFGAQLYDAVHDVLVGGICQQTSHVEQVVLADDGQRGSCRSGLGYLSMEKFGAQLPHDSGVVDSGSASYPLTQRGSGGTVDQVRADADGSVVISTREAGSLTFDPAGRLLTGDVPAPARTPWQRTSALWAPGSLRYPGIATVVAVHPNGRTVAVGSSDGTVTEIDVRAPTEYSVTSRWKSPDGAPIQAIGWSDQDDVLQVDTKAGLRWTPPSCAGCAEADTIMRRVADRLWMCYLEETLQVVNEATRDALGLRTCARPIEPEIG